MEHFIRADWNPITKSYREFTGGEMIKMPHETEEEAIETINSLLTDNEYVEKVKESDYKGHPANVYMCTSDARKFKMNSSQDEKQFTHYLIYKH